MIFNSTLCRVFPQPGLALRCHSAGLVSIKGSLKLQKSGCAAQYFFVNYFPASHSAVPWSFLCQCMQSRIWKSIVVLYRQKPGISGSSVAKSTWPWSSRDAWKPLKGRKKGAWLLSPWSVVLAPVYRIYYTRYTLSRPLSKHSSFKLGRAVWIEQRMRVKTRRTPWFEKNHFRDHFNR